MALVSAHGARAGMPWWVPREDAPPEIHPLPSGFYHLLASWFEDSPIPSKMRFPQLTNWSDGPASPGRGRGSKRNLGSADAGPQPCPWEGGTRRRGAGQGSGKGTEKLPQLPQDKHRHLSAPSGFLFLDSCALFDQLCRLDAGQNSWWGWGAAPAGAWPRTLCLQEQPCSEELGERQRWGSRALPELCPLLWGPFGNIHQTKGIACRVSSEWQ